MRGCTGSADVVGRICPASTRKYWKSPIRITTTACAAWAKLQSCRRSRQIQLQSPTPQVCATPTCHCRHRAVSRRSMAKASNTTTHDPGPGFRALHRPGAPFILANVWDIGSARLMAGLGAMALATSSAAHASTLGKADGGTVTRDEALSHAADVVAATPLPVSGDFEAGFG